MISIKSLKQLHIVYNVFMKKIVIACIITSLALLLFLLLTNKSLTIETTDQKNNSVGFQTTSIPGPHGSLDLAVWYQGYQNEEQKLKLYGDNIAFEGFYSPGAIPLESKQYPLVILMHGTDGNWRNLSWLAYTLAEYGYIVVSANHPGSSSERITGISALETWRQSQNVNTILDYLLDESDLAQVIDTDRISAGGNSLGGYTALSLGGAKLDFEFFLEQCKTNPSHTCDYVNETSNNGELFTEQFYELTQENYADNRVTAAFALTPGLTTGIIGFPDTTRTIVVSGEEDVNVPSTEIDDFIARYDFVHRERVAGMNHYSLLQSCKEGAREFLAQEGATFACNETTREREHFHAEVTNIVLNFLMEDSFYSLQ